MGRVKAELIDGMYVVGDLAYLPKEWDRLERRRAQQREHRRLNREKRDESVRKWRLANPDRVREMNRDHMRRKRLGQYRKLQVIGSLHDLRCYGPTKDTGCRCKKQLVVREVA